MDLCRVKQKKPMWLEFRSKWFYSPEVWAVLYGLDSRIEFSTIFYLLIGDNHVEEIAKLAMVIIQSTM